MTVYSQHSLTTLKIQQTAHHHGSQICQTWKATIVLSLCRLDGGHWILARQVDSRQHQGKMTDHLLHLRDWLALLKFFVFRKQAETFE